MHLSDLFKATLVCGGLAFVAYSFPVVSQITVILLLTLLWASCAHQTFRRLRRT